MSGWPDAQNARSAVATVLPKAKFHGDGECTGYDINRCSGCSFESAGRTARLYQFSTQANKGDMKANKNNSELDALLNAWLDGQLTEAEAKTLSEWIEESSEARERYWQLASVHGMIEQTMQRASLQAATGEQPVEPVRTRGLLGWSKLKAVAAGMVIGIFSASLAWAFKNSFANQPQRESPGDCLRKF